MPHDALQAICPSTGKATSGFQPRPPTWSKVDDAQLRNKSPHPSALVPVRAPPWPPPQRDLVGRIIGGKYAVSGILGGGGMGTIYEAEHVTIGRSVAIKVLHPTHACKKDAVQRFYREARAAGCISHPNVCEVYDLDSLNDGRPYLVMEKLVGKTLASRIAAEGRLPLHDLVHIVVQVLSALIAAHGKGIIHRDVKPDNVFLAGHPGCAPVAKLLDFGVSKSTAASGCHDEDDVDLTRRGMVIGTPHYLSPEQARGDRDLDARVDLYACGVVLYEALTGHRPFVAADHAALLHRILDARPRPARDLRRALPGGFDAVLAKAMAFHREERYRTAAEFQRDLLSLRDASPHVPIGANVAAASLPSESEPDADQQPTEVWVGRLPQPRINESAPPGRAPPPLRRNASDDLRTLVQRLPDNLLRAARRPETNENGTERN